MQVERSNAGGLGYVLREMRAQGVRGMWAGGGVNAVRVGIFGGTVTVGYAHGMKACPSDKFDPMEPFRRGLIGATASLFGCVLSHPLDVVRTRLTLQVPTQLPATPIAQHLARNCPLPIPHTPRYDGIGHALRSIIVKEGPAGLFRGLLPACLSVAPEQFVQLALCARCPKHMSAHATSD